MQTTNAPTSATWNGQTIPVTVTTVSGQSTDETYGVDADGNLYVWSTSLGEWWRENDATRINRERRAAGRNVYVTMGAPLDRTGRPNAFRGL